MKKKILIFSLAYYPKYVGGAEVAIQQITDKIPPEEIEFHMITLRFETTFPKTEKVGNVQVHRVGKSGSYISKILFVFRATFLARRLQREHEFDALWGLMTYMLFPIVLLRFLGIKIPYLLTLQDGDPYEHVFKRWFIRPLVPLLKIGFTQATVVQAISKHLAHWAHEKAVTCPIVVVPNGVDVERFDLRPTEEKRKKTREKLDMPTEGTALVTTSRLVHKNGLDDVIRAVSLLPEDVYFVIFGQGSDEEQLKSIAKEVGVSSRVKFMGHVEQHEIPEYLTACDIFIRPSRTEGMGNSFIEAMASRLPVIATQEGGLADFIFDTKRNPEKQTTAWAVDTDSPEQIAQAVKDILEHPEHTQKVVTTAYDMVSHTFRWDIVVKDMRKDVLSHLFKM